MESVSFVVLCCDLSQFTSETRRRIPGDVSNNNLGHEAQVSLCSFLATTAALDIQMAVRVNMHMSHLFSL